MAFNGEEMTTMVFGTKQGRLKDGTQVTLRPMTASDEEALFRFFQDLPDETLIFIRHDVKERRVIQEWAQRLDYNRVLPLLGLVGDEIVADVTLHRVPHGWKRHIGRVRVVVGTAYQKLGLATLMLNEIVELAGELGLEKLWAEVPLDSRGAIGAFRNAGFVCKAVIEGLVKDTRNQNMDILIMICDVAAYFDKRWARHKH
jgi:RimJ/RimL family protein N-acetyltransferase